MQACFQAKIRDLRRAHDEQLSAAVTARAGAGAGERLARVRYSDEKVANREIRVWHFVIENGC